MKRTHAFDLVGAGDDNSLDDVRSGSTVLKRGSSGNAVAVIQKLVGLSGDDVDGDYGPKTEKAVSAFQQSHGVRPVDGKVGKDTMAAIEKPPSITKIDFADDEVVTASPKKSGSAAVVKSDQKSAVPVPEASTEEGWPIVKYAAAGGLALATAGLAYAIFGR